MSDMIKNTITNAADITILRLIDNTYKTGGGPVSIAACVLQAPKGPPFRPVFVTDRTWKGIYGKPWHPREGGKAEGLRHLSEAARDCQGVQVVRVVAEDARFPSLAFLDDKDIVKDEHAYGTTLTAGAGVSLILYSKDGDPSENRKVKITAVNTVTERITLQVLETDAEGKDQVVEVLPFSFDPDAVDDMGVPAYIESVFEARSSRLGCVVGDEVELSHFEVMTNAVTFEGGTNGGEPTTLDYIRAWDIYRDLRIDLNCMFAAGNYDPAVLGNLAQIADGRHAQFFFDAPPSLRNDAAITWLNAAAIQSRQASCFHGAFSFTDPWYGGRAVWGYSGSAAAARARGNAIFAGNVPGVHYSLAGIRRGIVDRRGAKPLFGDDPLNKDAFYTARINPIIANETGVGVIIGDDLTLSYHENYSRFGWITSITNYIVHRFVQAATYAKFEPDGLTYDRLFELTTEIMEEMVTAGALVPPRNPDVDGDEPFVVTVEQLEIDLWKVTWEICPTGAARRIVGQPKLIK